MNKKIFYILLLVQFTLSWNRALAEDAGAPPDEKTLELERKIDDMNNRITALEEKQAAMSGLVISGFFDIFISNQQNNPNVFKTGGIEIDLEHNYSNNFNVAAAVQISEDSELKVGFIDYTLYGQTITTRGNVFFEKGLHLQVGKFDVPFGNDWEYFPSPLRTTFSQPLTTEIIMDGGYNDTGTRILLSFTALNFSAYLLRGMDKKESFGGNSFGGRLGITPFNNPYLLSFDRDRRVETGFSYIYDMDNGGNKSEEAYAFDFIVRLAHFFLRGEYILRKNIYNVSENGYHLTTGLNLKKLTTIPMTVFGRYDFYNIKNDTTANYDQTASNDDLDDSLKRITGGININISDISFIKLEFQKKFTTDIRFLDDPYYTEAESDLQLVIRF